MRRGQWQLGEDFGGMPLVMLRDGGGCRRGIDGERHAVVGEWVVEAQERRAASGVFTLGQLPESTPARAGLLLEQDFPFAPHPHAWFVEEHGFPPGFLTRKLR